MFIVEVNMGRLTPVPVSIAQDVMILLAAREGGAARLVDEQNCFGELRVEPRRTLVASTPGDQPFVWEKIEQRRRTVIAQYELLAEEGAASGKVSPKIHPRVVLGILLALAEYVLMTNVLATRKPTRAQAFESIPTMLAQGVLARRSPGSGASVGGSAQDRPTARRCRAKEARR